MQQQTKPNGSDRPSSSSTSGSRSPSGYVPSYREKMAEWEVKLLPAALEAEAAVLGAILLQPAEMGNVLPILPDGSWFGNVGFGLAYRAMIAMWSERGVIDIVGLKQRLEDAKVLDRVGGVEMLLKLGESVPDPSSAAYYAGIVREKSTARRLMDACGKAMQAGFDLQKPAEILESLNREITALALGVRQHAPSTLGEMLQDLYDELGERKEGDGGGIPSGFYGLDTLLSGLHGGQMIVVAGRPSMGKSLFAGNVAENFAQRGDGVLFISAEMSKRELATRFACSLAGVDFDRLRKNMLAQIEFERLQEAVGRVSDWPMMVDDTPGPSPNQLKATARRVAQKIPLKLIIVDYMQLMNGAGDTRQEVVSGISRELKAIAKELNVPVIAISQLNRGVETRDEKRPRMSDLRESGAIEQDADVILFLHRPHYYMSEAEKQNNDHLKYFAEVIVAKQRNGPCGMVPLIFDGVGQRFKNAAHETQGSLL